ncbi:MAG: FAD-dependent oxidoreductase [Pseudomonadota bacterium]
MTLPDHARAVIIGGGNMGAGVLYHLAAAGWSDCVLIEKAELTSGATWHAAGLVSRMVGGHALGAMHDYAVDLYKTIEAETGQAVSWHGCGSMRVATSDDHLDWIHHLRDAILARGQLAEIVDPAEARRLNPLYDGEAAGIRAALYTPDDGHVDPAGTCFAMARGARDRGATIVRRCRVTDTRFLPTGEWEVVTESGSIRCEHVVNAAGYHARQVGAFSGLDLPIVTMLHHYVLTDDVPEFAAMDHEIPVTRDDHFSGYLRREQASALIGLYDRQDPQSVWLDGCPWESENELFDPNMEGILPWLEACFERFPSLAERGLKRIVNGGITYTPDGAMLLGPAPGLRNYWLACGATVGIAWGPGAGRALAEWIVEGSATQSTRAFDPRRFGIWADPDFARARAREDYTLRQAMPYPQVQRVAERSVKVSGAKASTRALGAIFEEAGGWERPRLYADEPFGWRRSSDFEQVAREVQAVRQRVGLGDFSAFAKFELSGSGAEAFLDRACANRIPKRMGGTALTLFLNRRGTIEGEATIVRIDDDRFYLVTGAPSERRVWDWLTVHCGVPATDVDFKNRTDEIGILTLAGPDARHVLAGITDAEVGNAALPWLSARTMTVAGLPCRVLRLSFTGELAFEIHAPNGRLDELWNALWKAGEAFDIGPFGSKAIDSLRMEKFYRGGHELTNDVSPLEIDLMRFVRVEKCFVGKPALRERRRGATIALLALEGEEADALGGEAVYLKNDLVGSVTSGAYGHTIGASLVIAFLKDRARMPGTKVAISLLGRRIPARVLDGAPYDPDNHRLKA